MIIIIIILPLNFTLQTRRVTLAFFSFSVGVGLVLRLWKQDQLCGRLLIKRRRCDAV